MKIALIQQHAVLEKSENLKRGFNSACKAIDNGANIICFAELAFDQFYPQRLPESDCKKLAETIPGKTTDIFTKLAKDSDTIILLNMFELDGDKTFDTSPVIDNSGVLVGKTRMMHIPDYELFHEKKYYTPGNSGTSVYNTKYGKLGIAICYDRHFPEYMRALALKGAEIVFVPQAGSVGEWPEGLFEAEMRIAAFQNGYFTALCNRVGKEELIEFSGESFICDPHGKIIARANKGVDEILYCDIDLNEVSKSHAKKLFFPDRRTALYKDWFG